MNDNPLPPMIGSPTEAASAAYIARMLEGDDDYDTVVVAGLPEASIYIAGPSVMIVTTTAPAPTYRSAIRAAAVAWGADVILLRVPEIDDGLLTISIDLAAAALPCRPWIEHDLSLAIYDGVPWLVPDCSGPCFSISPDGLNLEMVAPFDTALQRRAGVIHAAHVLAQIADPMWVR